MKEFVIDGLSLLQDKCAMKIGTDSVLLGRWAADNYQLSIINSQFPKTLLDIGTGTGLLALLMAVRFPDLKVTGIDIDEGAYLQAKENVERNGLQGRVEVLHRSLQEMEKEEQAKENHSTFDAIICNPPYFQNSLKCPDTQRNTARHTDTLSFHDLMSVSARLLSPSGTISLIIPTGSKATIDYEAALAGLQPTRVTPVQTSPRKPVKRYLLEYSK